MQTTGLQWPKLRRNKLRGNQCKTLRGRWLSAAPRRQRITACQHESGRGRSFGVKSRGLRGKQRETFVVAVVRRPLPRGLIASKSSKSSNSNSNNRKKSNSNCSSGSDSGSRQLHNQRNRLSSYALNS